MNTASFYRRRDFRAFHAWLADFAETIAASDIDSPTGLSDQSLLIGHFAADFPRYAPLVERIPAAELRLAVAVLRQRAIAKAPDFRDRLVECLVLVQKVVEVHEKRVKAKKP